MTTFVSATENQELAFSSATQSVMQDIANRIHVDDHSTSSQSILKHASRHCCENCKQQSCAAR